jgi:excisionase family DNA binding protein
MSETYLPPDVQALIAGKRASILWVTIPEAAEYIGVSTKTIRRWITRGTIEARRFGPRLIRVNLASLDSSGRPLEGED